VTRGRKNKEKNKGTHSEFSGGKVFKEGRDAGVVTRLGEKKKAVSKKRFKKKKKNVGSKKRKNTRYIKTKEKTRSWGRAFRRRQSKKTWRS